MAISTETKVGAFFLIALAILGWFTFHVQNLGDAFAKTKTLTAHFTHAASLQAGDGVFVAGLRVGEIESLQLNDDGVVVTMQVKADAPVRESSEAVAAWGGLLGNRFIDITLGDPADPILPDGGVVKTRPSIEIETVLRKVDQAAAQLSDMLKSSDVGPNLGKLVENLLAISDDIRNQKGTMGKLISSSDLHDKAVAIADDLKETAENLNKLVADNDERIGSILENLDKAAPEMRDAFAGIKRLTEQAETGKGILPALLNDEKMYEDLKGSLAKLNASLVRVDELTESIQKGEGLMGKMIGDEKLAQDVTDAVESLKNVAERLDKGDNTLARLTRDKDLYEDVKKTLDDAREMLRTAKEQLPVGTFASVILSAF